MRKYFLPLLASAILASCADTKEKFPEGIEHVFVIGVDGQSPDGIRNAKTPVMDNMVQNGAVKWNVRTVLTTASSQNWASMIMGAGPEAHGIIDNDWEKDNHSLPSIVIGEEGIFPTIFGRIREAKPNAEIGAVYHWGGFGRLFEKKVVNYDVKAANEDSATILFTNYIREKKPTFGFVHFDHVDHAGHHDGHGSPQYYEAVAKTDSLVGVILKSLDEAGIADKSLVIITADHGGLGKGHGGPTPEQAEIAMILYGRGIKKGYKIEQQVYTYDLAATIAYAFHITPPYAWTGRPIKPAFEGHNEPANLYKGVEPVIAPVIHPKSNMNAPAGGLYTEGNATVTIKSSLEGAEIRYTLNGGKPDKNSALYTEPFTVDSTTVVKAIVFDKSGNESPVAAGYFRVVKPTASTGLNVSLYKGDKWLKLPDFKKLTPVKKWNSLEVDIDESILKPLYDGKNECFGVVFDGYIQIDKPGKYKFYTQSDDGSKLYVKGELVVNNDGDHGVQEKSGSITLEAGKHPFRVEHFNVMGAYFIAAFYEGPGMTKQIIPANKLYNKI